MARSKVSWAGNTDNRLQVALVGVMSDALKDNDLQGIPVQMC